MFTSNTKDRNHDFLCMCRRQFRRLQAEGKTPTVERVVADVLAGRAPAYYIEYEVAYRAMVGYMKGKPMREDLPMCSRWHADMYRDLCELLREKPLVPLRELICTLLRGEEGNPRFYLSRRRAMGILRPHINPATL